MGYVDALHDPIHQGLKRLVDKSQRHDLVHGVLEVPRGGGVGVGAADEDVVIGVQVSVGIGECLDDLVWFEIFLYNAHQLCAQA